MAKHCSVCGGTDHTQFYCRQKPRKAIQSKTPLAPSTKRLAQVGKQGKRTAAAVAKWKPTIPSNHQGYWKCYICARMVDYLMAEHPFSKTRHPELREADEHYEPTCSDCNALKGSLDIVDFLFKYPQYQRTVKKKYLDLLERKGVE